jgi:hypothetical protein
MKHGVRLTGALLLAFAVSTITARAQVPYSQGTVTRVVLLSILPGHSDALFADLKKNIVPLWEAEKSAGLILDYSLFLNQTSSGPNDWDVGYTLTYKNMAALDGLPDKLYEFRMKQYGSKEDEQKVIEKRVENAKVVTSSLLRGITLAAQSVSAAGSHLGLQFSMYFPLNAVPVVLTAKPDIEWSNVDNWALRNLRQFFSPTAGTR